MSELTPFAGLEVLAPGDPLSIDGFRFQLENPKIIDALLKLGAETHKHDEKPGLVTPTPAPTITNAITGGAIAGSQTIYTCFTLIDAQGGETLPSATSQVSTPEKYPDPQAEPNATVDYTAGALLANNYNYGVTVTDGAGGETAISPTASVVVAPGFANARVKLTELAKIIEEVTSGGAPEAKWRLWRAAGGGPWDLLAAGTGETFTDDGSVSPDCNVSPPAISTVQGTNEITITLTDPAQPTAAYYRLYASTDGGFPSPSLIGQFPISEVTTPHKLKELTLNSGGPALVSTSYKHADKINPDTDILDFHWKRPKKKVSELPTEGNEAGDVRIVEEPVVAIYLWDNVGKTWAPLTATAAHWLAPFKKFSELPAEGNVDGDVRLVLETRRLYSWNNEAKEWVGVRTVVETCEAPTWSTAGPILAAPSIPGPFRRNFTGETQALIGIEAEVAVGKATFTLLVNGVAITELKEVVVEGVFALDLAEPLALAPKDKLSLRCDSSEGGEDLAYTAFVRHTSVSHA